MTVHAIPTSEYSQAQCSPRPTLVNACTMAIALVCASSACSFMPPEYSRAVGGVVSTVADTADTAAFFDGAIISLCSNSSVLRDDRARSLEQIREIEELQYNWNGNEAARFSADLVKKARSVIMQLPIQPDIFPTARDSIQFEYENNVGDYLEFELFQNRLKVFSYDHSGNTMTRDTTVEEMTRMVNQFYGRDI